MTLVPRSHLTASQYAQLIPSARVVVFDVETTGLNPKTDEIIELGAVELEGLSLGRVFRELAKPVCRIRPEATEVHGYTAEVLKGQQNSLDLVDHFMDWLGSSEVVLAGHNSAFDLEFLRTSVSVLNKVRGTQWVVPAQTLCTMRWIQDSFEGRVLDLDTSCRLFGVKRSNRTRHAALEDAKFTARLLTTLMSWSHFADSVDLPRKRFKKSEKQGGRVLPWLNKC